MLPEPVAWMATPVMQSGRGTTTVFCSDKRMADQWDYGGHPEYGRMLVTKLLAEPDARALLAQAATAAAPQAQADALDPSLTISAATAMATTDAMQKCKGRCCDLSNLHRTVWRHSRGAFSINHGRYAPPLGSVFGLVGQPFWFYAAWETQQWGIFALCVLYTITWGKGFYTNWIS